MDNDFYPEGYAFLHPEVQDSGLSPWDHYCQVGRAQGYTKGQPMPDQFDAVRYLSLYPDVARAHLDPWQHYVEHGYQEGRSNGLQQKIVFDAQGKRCIIGTGSASCIFYLDMVCRVRTKIFLVGWSTKNFTLCSLDGHALENPLMEKVYRKDVNKSLHMSDTVERGFAICLDAVRESDESILEIHIASQESPEKILLETAQYDLPSILVKRTALQKKMGKTVYTLLDAALSNAMSDSIDEDAASYDIEDRQLVADSLFFDYDFYLAQGDCGDMDPVVHYLTLGYREGRDPSAFFSGKAYFAQNPDVSKDTNPLVHFLTRGQAEKRYLSRQMADDAACIRDSGQCDSVYYLQTYFRETERFLPDPLWHFVVYGAANGNNPNAHFDSAKFLYQNPDVPENVNLFAWYLRHRDAKKLFCDKAQWREYESIQKSKLFDAAFYAKTYKVPVDDALFHYVTQGYVKDCNPSASFHNKEYLAINSDVDCTDISPLGHYCRFGQKEGRYTSQRDKVYQVIKNSSLFDRDYYSKTLPPNIDPYQHYITHGNNEGRNPSPDFNTRLYQALNPDAFLQGVNALYHYETAGRVQKRELTFGLQPTVDFPPEAVETEGEGQFSRTGMGRVAIFSSFDSTGILTPRAAYYLTALQEICDAIVVVMDNPVLPESLDVLRPLCTHYLCRRHRMYDFGSYKLGLEYVYSTLQNDSLKEIVLCNDSLYGPLHGFGAVFTEMASRPCDVWGLSLSRTHWYESLQSFFYVVRRRAFLSEAFRAFFADVHEETNRAFVVTRYELRFTQYLRDHGLTCAAFVEAGEGLCAIPTKQPLLLIRDYAFPLIKRKAIFEDCLENKRAVLDYVREHNVELYTIMVNEGCERHLRKERQECAKTATDYQVVRQSPLFDAAYYARNNYDVDLEGLDPVESYLQRGNRVDPSADFCSEEYGCINPDINLAHLNALLHYERYGHDNRETRLVDLQTQADVTFPETSKDVECLWQMPKQPQTAAVFVGFSAAARVEEYVVYYLRHLRAVVDTIVYVADNPLLPHEEEKLRDLADVVICRRHGKYDFGSYALGVAKLRSLLDMDTLDELVLCNDSCVGPIDGFDTMFAAMRSRNLDVWSVTKNTFGTPHPQSFFLVLGKKVFLSKEFAEFLESIAQEVSAWNVIVKYEIGFSQRFCTSAFTWDAYTVIDGITNPILQPYAFLLRGMPILKTKFLQGKYRELPDYDEILDYIARRNPELSAIIKRTFISGDTETEGASGTLPVTPSAFIPTERAGFPPLPNDRPLVVHFYVQQLSMFAARALFERLRGDVRFKAVCVVVPDLRFGLQYEYKTRQATLEALREQYGQEAVLPSWNAAGEYQDMSDMPDMVCYSTSYTSTPFVYSVKYLSQKKRTFLINYGFFRSQYDRTIYRRDEYALFWKVFLETEDNLREAQQYTTNQAKNAEVVGYAKMDSLAPALAQAQTDQAARPTTILIAPHHSLPGGYNKVMHLSNFQKYHELYVLLPLMFPQCHFIFRPHPMLFQLLAKKDFWGKAKLDAWIKKLTTTANLELHEAPDYFDIFARSDALINDCGSYLVEYFYTQKPQCYLLTDPQEEQRVFSLLGRECLRRVYKAYDAGQITGFINNVVLGKQDVLRQERERFAKDVIMKNYPHVCEKIVEVLLAKAK